MPCVKIIELIGTSPKSFDEAVKEGLKRAAKSVRGISGIDIIGQTAKVENGKITMYKVNMKVAFQVE